MDWKVMIGEIEEPAPNADILRAWLSEKRIRPDSHVFHPAEGKWICLRDVKELADLFVPNQTLIDKYREDYGRALIVLDHEVADLIHQGKEMRALMLLSDCVSQILKIHESLQIYYGAILRHLSTLKRFGSERLRQLGHDPICTRELLKYPKNDAEKFSSMVNPEKYVEDELSSIGYTRTHWWFNAIVLREVDYMLDALQILVEPEFVPLETRTVDQAEPPDRRISPNVKINVWRRDEGQCVLCKSREKLEYDHIIPVVKGGSNTERNIQLLCEPCNRTKAAQIQ